MSHDPRDEQRPRRHGEAGVLADIATLDAEACFGLAAPIEYGTCRCEARCLCDDEEGES